MIKLQYNNNIKKHGDILKLFNKLVIKLKNKHLY